MQSLYVSLFGSPEQLTLQCIHFCFLLYQWMLLDKNRSIISLIVFFSIILLVFTVQQAVCMQSLR